jgi:hypothetical protein
MADNAKVYGIRWATSYNGGRCPPIISGHLASGYQGAINGGSNVHVRKGDPVRRLSTGYWELADGSEGAGGGETVDGIVAAVYGYKDATTGHFVTGPHVPGATTYTDLESEGSRIGIIPTHAGRFEIDCDDKTTATTYAAYHAFIGENADHILLTGSEPKANPLLDISDHGTATAQWRIIAISKSAENRDYAGLYVKMIVEINETTLPAFSATGV